MLISGWHKKAAKGGDEYRVYALLYHPMKDY